MHGKIFPADHPFWDIWFPPNGFRCRCGVDSVSAAELKTNGWQVEEKDPTNTLFEPTDPVTGVKLPARQLLPDPGWNYNPGKVAAMGAERVLADSLPKLRPDIGARVLNGLRDSLSTEVMARLTKLLAGGSA